MKVLRLSYFCILFCIFLGFNSNAQIESPFSKGAAAIGLGNAFAATTDHYTILYNQAGIADLENISFSVDAGQLYNNSGLFHFHAAGVFPSKKLGNFGIRIQQYGLEGYSAQNFSFTYARSLLRNFKVAATFNMHQFRIENYGKTFVPNFEIGVLGKLSDQISLGAHLSNPLPLQISDQTNFPTVLSMGVQYRVSEIVGVNVDFEKSIKEKENIKIGIYYAIHPKFQLRAGVNTSPGSFHFGFSLLLKKLNLHIGNAFHPVLGNSIGLGIVYRRL